MMTKDCKHWLTFAEQKQAAYKSGRPELLKDNEVFRQKAREAGIESEFDEALKRSEDLEKKCINFLSNAFQAYVTATALGDKNFINLNVLPTGTGKTWIAVLLSSVLTSRGSRNAIVTSDTYLVKQFEDMLGQCR